MKPSLVFFGRRFEPRDDFTVPGVWPRRVEVEARFVAQGSSPRPGGSPPILSSRNPHLSAGAPKALPGRLRPRAAEFTYHQDINNVNARRRRAQETRRGRFAVPLGAFGALVVKPLGGLCGPASDCLRRPDSRVFVGSNRSNLYIPEYSITMISVRPPVSSPSSLLASSGISGGSRVMKTYLPLTASPPDRNIPVYDRWECRRTAPAQPAGQVQLVVRTTRHAGRGRQTGLVRPGTEAPGRASRGGSRWQYS